MALDLEESIVGPWEARHVTGSLQPLELLVPA
jgi:hypothetical protein